MPDRRYWDSDCFLGWLQAEPDKEEKCRAVLEAAVHGEILIVSSALTIAEVLAVRGHEKISPHKRTMVENFFRNEYIVIRNVTRRIAEMARSMVWDHNIAPKDAIHVATAIDAKLQLFNTFDRPLCGHSRRVGVPPLTIELPQIDQPRLQL